MAVYLDTSISIIEELKEQMALYSGESDRKKMELLRKQGKNLEAMNYFLKSRKKDRPKIIIKNIKSRGYKRR